MRINRLKGAGIAAALSLAAIVGTVPAVQAVEGPPPVVAAAGTANAVKWTAIGVIGTATVLVSYDLLRRFGCTGDFLKLGGPGFTGPVGNQAVMPPRCPPR